MERNTRFGLLALSILLSLSMFLLIALSLTDNIVFWLLFAVIAMTTFVVGVVLGVSMTQAHHRTANADAAKLAELEPLPPAADELDRP